jgi:hypothetical protein
MKAKADPIASMIAARVSSTGDDESVELVAIRNTAAPAAQIVAEAGARDLEDAFVRLVDRATDPDA